MQVKSIAECSTEHSAIHLTCIKLSHGFKTFVLSFFEWPFKRGYTVPLMRSFNCKILQETFSNTAAASSANHIRLTISC